MTGPAVRRRLSAGQARLWFLQRLNGASGLYNEFACVRLRGVLSVPALEQALDAVAGRHESLRYRIVEQHGACVAVPRDTPYPGWIQVVDLTGVAGAARERAYRDAVADAVRRPCVLETGPLARVWLCRLEASEVAMVLMMHHIISDAWSMQILVEDFCRAYRAIARGQPDAADIVEYGDAPEPDASEDADLAYWIQTLAEPPPPVALPTHRARAAARTFAGAKEYLSFDAPWTACLKARAREAHVTTFIMLLALWTAYLGVTAGRRDLIVGTTAAGRDRPEAARRIGFFVETLALRLRVAPAEAFRAHLRRARIAALDALAHRRTPFERVVRALRLPRTPQQQPLFETMFVYVNTAVFDLSLPGVSARLTPEDVVCGLTKYDLVVSFCETGSAITGLFDYSRELYDAREIHGHVTRFQAFATRALADMDRPLQHLIPLAAAPAAILEDLRGARAARARDAAL